MIHSWHVTSLRRANQTALGVQCNYFGAVALTYQLLDILQASAPSRIINMSSRAEAFAVIDWDNLKWAPFLYCQCTAIDSEALKLAPFLPVVSICHPPAVAPASAHLDCHALLCQTPAFRSFNTRIVWYHACP
jgi:hypothetical protein